MRFALVALLAAGSISSSWQKKDDLPKATNKLWASICTNRPVYRLPFATSGEEQFMLNFGVVNDGDKTVDCEPDSFKLLINGVVHPFAIGVGTNSKSQLVLRPGESSQFGFPLIRNFDKPVQSDLERRWIRKPRIHLSSIAKETLNRRAHASKGQA
jgi:hypothetical protein